MLPLNNPEDVRFKEPSPAQPTLGDVASAGFELATQETFVTTWARDTALDELENGSGKTLTPEEANEKYPYVELKFDQPINETAAHFLNEEAYRKHELRQTIENGPTGSGFVNFVAGSVAHLLDPVEFAAGALTGMGLTRVAGQVAKSSAGALGNLAKTIAQPSTVAGTFAREATENVIGNAVAETYIVNRAERARIDYGIQDAFVNSVAAGILGGGLSTGIKYGAKGLNSIIGKSEIATDIALKGTVSQLEANVKPTPGVVETAWRDLAYGEPKLSAVSNTNYVFKPVNLADIPNQSFFAPTKMTNSMDGGTRKFGHDFGDGITLTDNPNIANNIAGNALEDGVTSIAEMRISEARLIDLDEPIQNVPFMKQAFHGSNVPFQKFDDRSGGFVFFGENQSVADRYAQGAGGGRVDLPLEKMDLVYNGEKIPRNEAGNFVLEGKALDTRELARLVNDPMSEYSLVPQKTFTKKVGIGGAKILDVTAKQGRQEISEILSKIDRASLSDYARRQYDILVKTTKDELEEQPGAQGFNSRFWSLTKFASKGAEQKELTLAIKSAIKEAGYEGLRFLDDEHKTIALFSEVANQRLLPDDFNLSLPENLRPLFENIETLRQGVDNVRAAIDEGSLKDVDFENMNDAIKAAGFDGYKLSVAEGKQQFNQIHLFPESGSKAQAAGYRKVDTEALPELDAGTLNKVAEARLDKKNQLEFDEDVQIEADKLVVPKEINEAEIKGQIDENFATLERMEQQGLLTEEASAMVAEMRKERTFFEKLPEMVNEFANCLLGGN